MKAVKILLAAASIAGATVPAAGPAAAANLYVNAPVAVTVGPRPYYGFARYVWGHYHNGYFQADPHWVAYDRVFASAQCRMTTVRHDDGLVRRVRRCF